MEIRSFALVPTSWKPQHLKSGHLRPDFKRVLTKWRPFVWISNGRVSKFQMVGLPDFRSQSKSRPFATHPLFDHSESRLVKIWNPDCISGRYQSVHTPQLVMYKIWVLLLLGLKVSNNIPIFVWVCLVLLWRSE